MHLVLSLISLISRSISPTCSLAAVVFVSSRPTRSSTLSNSLSIRANRTINPPFAYNLTIFLRDLASCPAFLLGMYSAVTNFIFLERVTKSGSPHTNMTSAVRVTNLFSLYQSLGILTLSSTPTLLLGFRLVAAPFNLSRLCGPRMEEALARSSTVTGQFFRDLVLTIRLNSLSGGHPIRF